MTEEVNKRFSVSLVYRKHDGNSIHTKLLVVIISKALNEAEALGAAILHFSNETKNYDLSLRAVIEIYEQKESKEEPETGTSVG